MKTLLHAPAPCAGALRQRDQSNMIDYNVQPSSKCVNVIFFFKQAVFTNLSRPIQRNYVACVAPGAGTCTIT
jgi:hypothetical protein